MKTNSKTSKTAKTIKTASKTSKPVAAAKPTKKAAAVAPKSKAPEVTEALVGKIKGLLKFTSTTQAAIVKATKLPRSTVWNIAAGKTWADVKPVKPTKK